MLRHTLSPCSYSVIDVSAEKVRGTKYLLQHMVSSFRNNLKTSLHAVNGSRHPKPFRFQAVPVCEENVAPCVRGNGRQRNQRVYYYLAFESTCSNRQITPRRCTSIGFTPASSAYVVCAEVYGRTSTPPLGATARVVVSARNEDLPASIPA